MKTGGAVDKIYKKAKKRWSDVEKAKVNSKDKNYLGQYYVSRLRQRLPVHSSEKIETINKEADRLTTSKGVNGKRCLYIQIVKSYLIL